MLLLAPLAHARLADSGWPPWGYAAQTEEPPSAIASPGAASPARVSFDMLMLVYKRVVSPVAGKHCPMYPSCSSYAVDAVREHGTVVGLLMAFDRLHRCGHDLRFYELVYVEGRLLRYDPVSNGVLSAP